MTGPVRIAMWSGPRNLSTAMMRSFGNRPDTTAIDEPFYAAYLAATGLDHPMRAEILAAQPTDPRAVVEGLFAPLPAGRRIHYQKHMTHHMVPSIPRDWFGGVVHAFLIRRPEDVLASYAQKREAVTLEDIGFVQQHSIFRAVGEATGSVPVVVEADAILARPRAVLARLCEALAIPFAEEMLAWPAGRRPEDGVWAPHWYGAVERSTGFSPPRAPVDRADLPEPLRAIADGDLEAVGLDRGLEGRRVGRLQGAELRLRLAEAGLGEGATVLEIGDRGVELAPALPRGARHGRVGEVGAVPHAGPLLLPGDLPVELVADLPEVADHLVEQAQLPLEISHLERLRPHLAVPRFHGR